MKYKIEKGSVQETLLIPLYGRKMAMDLYPDLFADTDCQRLFDRIDLKHLCYLASKRKLVQLWLPHASTIWRLYAGTI